MALTGNSPQQRRQQTRRRQNIVIHMDNVKAVLQAV
jgi:hypothetical protein